MNWDDYLFLFMLFLVVPFTVFFIARRTDSDSIWNSLSDYERAHDDANPDHCFRKMKIGKLSMGCGFKLFYKSGKVIIIPCSLFRLLGRSPKKLRAQEVDTVGDVVTFTGKLRGREIDIKAYRKNAAASKM